MTNEELIANGFVPTTYEGQQGTFYVKTTTVKLLSEHMAHELLLDCEMLYPEDDVIFDVIDNKIRLLLMRLGTSCAGAPSLAPRLAMIKPSRNWLKAESGQPLGFALTSPSAFSSSSFNSQICSCG